MKCYSHPVAEACATCDDCSAALCGVCANYEKDGIFCERCLRTGEQLRPSDTPKPVKEATAPGRSGNKGAMARLLSEGEIQHRAKKLANDKKSEQKKTHPARRDKLIIGVVFFCSVFIAYRIITSVQESSPLNQQEIIAEEQARNDLEKCILVFWEIAAVLQNNGTPDPALQCTEAGAPMIINRVDNDLIVRHPRPRSLGFSEIFVSRSNPTPILVE